MVGPRSKPNLEKGPYQPLVILHGGAGSITRAGLPPSLYESYHASLKSYLESTYALLEGNHGSNPGPLISQTSKIYGPANAVEAAVHAVSCFEEDPLFNCGHGSVFTTSGEIQMEASLAVSSIHSPVPEYLPGHIKKSAAVSTVTQTRHPIQLAKLVLEMADTDEDNTQVTCGKTTDDSHGDRTYLRQQQSSNSVRHMHGHLSGEWIENYGFRQGLEKKDKRWFWTRKRWDEHRRGLGLDHSDKAWKKKLEDAETDETETSATLEATGIFEDTNFNVLPQPDHMTQYHDLPSQGTVGAVCMDSWGNLAVATSTGGLTNKRSGRIGDTPTIGAGFWAGSWQEPVPSTPLSHSHSSFSSETVPQQDVCHGRRRTWIERLFDTTTAVQEPVSWLHDCLPGVSPQSIHPTYPAQSSTISSSQSFPSQTHSLNSSHGHLLSATDSPLIEKRPPITPPKLTYPTPATEINTGITSTRSSARQIRAIALSGTGNGDSFLRTCATHTTASILRFHNNDNNTTTSTQFQIPPSASTSNSIISPLTPSSVSTFQSFTAAATTTTTNAGNSQMTLAEAVTRVAGPNGELQQSAEDRWGTPGGGEGEGGIIGIEIVRKYDAMVLDDNNEDGQECHWNGDHKSMGKDEKSDEVEARVAFDFNCGGMWRAYFVDDGDGERRAKVMVFKEEYY